MAHLNKCDNYEQRKQWFMDRIGKIVYRTKTTCDCEVCTNAYENGIVIADEMHAIYLCDMESEGVVLRYFDTKEEVKEFELK